MLSMCTRLQHHRVYTRFFFVNSLFSKRLILQFFILNFQPSVWLRVSTLHTPYTTGVACYCCIIIFCWVVATHSRHKSSSLLLDAAGSDLRHHNHHSGFGSPICLLIKSSQLHTSKLMRPPFEDCTSTTGVSSFVAGRKDIAYKAEFCKSSKIQFFLLTQYIPQIKLELQVRVFNQPPASAPSALFSLN